MNESPAPATTTQVAPRRDSLTLGVVSLILACIAFTAPLLHWVVVLVSTYGYDTTAESFGAAALGIVLVLLVEWTLLPTVGVAGLITAVVALVRSPRSKVFALIALGVSFLSLISVIIQILYWAGAFLLNS